MNIVSRTIVVVVATCALAMSACVSQKEPAEAALKASRDAFASIQPKAVRLVPDQATAVQTSLTAAQAAFDKGDYAAVLQQTTTITTQIATLAAAMTAKTEELAPAWNAMKAAVPALGAALERRVSELSKSATLPAGITKKMVSDAYDAVATVTIEWSKVLTGDLDTAAATAKAAELKALVETHMASLQMKVPSGE